MTPWRSLTAAALLLRAAIKVRCLMPFGGLLIFGAAVHAQEIVTLSTRPGVTQSYFLTSTPKTLQARAVLFPGSGGSIQLRMNNGQPKFDQGNFLVRSRAEFVKRGVVAAIVDAPSDQQAGWGMGDEFRLGDSHFADISAVIEDINKRFPGVPLFLVGTSRGTVSAAALGARLGQRLAGVVLTSTVFRPTPRNAKEPGPGLSRFDFATISTPLLFVHHLNDQCEMTLYSEAARHSGKYPLLTVFGGTPPKSGPCDAFSAHGYFGRESETVEQLVNWMLKKPVTYELR
jgi:pimeloyl-ACP methyl ester carboxylesterase